MFWKQWVYTTTASLFYVRRVEWQTEDLQKIGSQNAAQYEMCVGMDAPFATAWELVHAWPQLKKDEVICIPSVHLSIQYEVLPAHKGCERGTVLVKVISEQKCWQFADWALKKKVPTGLEDLACVDRACRLIN